MQFTQRGTSIMIELERYYNDKEWDNFVGLCSSNWSNSTQQIDLLNTLHGLKDIAIVIWTTHNLMSKSWIEKEIPALDDLKPIDCLKDGNLIRRLKVCLLRTP